MMTQVEARVEAQDFAPLHAPELSSPVVEVRGLRKVFPGKDKRPLAQRLLGRGERPRPFVAVQGVSFGIGQGEIFGLLGPNGAGFADVATDITRLALFGLALPVAGVALFALTERRSRRTGDLGQY